MGLMPPQSSCQIYLSRAMGGSDDSQIQIPKTIILPEFKKSQESLVEIEVEDSSALEEAESSTSETTSNVPFFSGYTKQKAAATGLFAFSFLVGDWWWDGSNGFSALIESTLSVSEMPIWASDARRHMYSVYGFSGILILISWALWEIAPLVFFWGFALSWRGSYGAGVNDEPSNPLGGPEELEQRRRSGKSSYRFLISFSILLFVLDCFQNMVWYGWDLLAIPNILSNFGRDNIWQVIAFGAVFGLNPENEWSWKSWSRHIRVK